MSGLLAGKIWQSALDPKLKPIAAALADIGDDDGSHIYPSVAYTAWLLGDDPEPTQKPRMESTVHRGLRALLAQGILVKVGRNRDGRTISGGRSTVEYRLNERALPTRTPWKSNWEKGANLTPNDAEKGAKPAGRKVPNGAEKGVKKPEKGGMGDTLTVLDPSIEPSIEPSYGENREKDDIAKSFGRFGLVTAATAEAIDYTVEDFGIDWTRRALRAAAGAGFEGRPPWAYIDSICERWKKQGGPDDEQPRIPVNQRSNGRHSEPEDLEQRAARL